MAGVKGRSGGARAGSGRKRQDVIVQQAKRREVVLAVVDDDAWTKLVRKWLTLAETQPVVLHPLLPYILGGKQQGEAAAGGATITLRIENVDRRDARPDIRILDAS